MLCNKPNLLEWESSAGVLPVLLTSCLQGYSFWRFFQFVFPAYPLQLLSICVLSTAFKTFCSNNLGIHIQYLPPASMKVTRLMSLWPKMQGTPEKFKKTRSLGLLQCSEIDSDYLRCSNLSWEIHEYGSLSSCHVLPADRRNKTPLEYWLATLNALLQLCHMLWNN